MAHRVEILGNGHVHFTAVKGRRPALLLHTQNQTVELWSVTVPESNVVSCCIPWRDGTESFSVTHINLVNGTLVANIKHDVIAKALVESRRAEFQNFNPVKAMEVLPTRDTKTVSPSEIDSYKVPQAVTRAVTGQGWMAKIWNTTKGLLTTRQASNDQAASPPPSAYPVSGLTSVEEKEEGTPQAEGEERGQDSAKHIAPVDSGTDLAMAGISPPADSQPKIGIPTDSIEASIFLWILKTNQQMVLDGILPSHVAQRFAEFQRNHEEPEETGQGQECEFEEGEEEEEEEEEEALEAQVTHQKANIKLSAKMKGDCGKVVPEPLAPALVGRASPILPTVLKSRANEIVERDIGEEDVRRSPARLRRRMTPDRTKQTVAKPATMHRRNPTISEIKHWLTSFNVDLEILTMKTGEERRGRKKKKKKKGSRQPDVVKEPEPDEKPHEKFEIHPSFIDSIGGAYDSFDRKAQKRSRSRVAEHNAPNTISQQTHRAVSPARVTPAPQEDLYFANLHSLNGGPKPKLRYFVSSGAPNTFRSEKEIRKILEEERKPPPEATVGGIVQQYRSVPSACGTFWAKRAQDTDTAGLVDTTTWPSLGEKK